MILQFIIAAVLCILGLLSGWILASIYLALTDKKRFILYRRDEYGEVQYFLWNITWEWMKESDIALAMKLKEESAKARVDIENKDGKGWYYYTEEIKFIDRFLEKMRI